MADKIYEVEPIYDGIDEDGERRRLPRNEVVLTKQQLSRFRSASEKLHGNDRAYNRASYAYFFLKLLCLVLALLMIRFFIAEPTYVDGESMVSTLIDNERVFVEKVSYWFTEPKRGDIVIVHFPDRNERFVKRVIAVGGETVSIANGYVEVNGERIDESEYAGDWYGRINILINCEGSVNGSYTVPYGYIFVMGDNRNYSHDSRAADVGPIALDQVIGKAHFVIWPLTSIRDLYK